MPAKVSKLDELVEDLHRSMSRLIRSKNPALDPAVCNVARQDSADLAESDLMYVAVNLHNRLTDEGHAVDVRYIKTPDARYHDYQFVSTPLDGVL